MKKIEIFLIIIKICEGKVYNSTDLLQLGMSINRVLLNPGGDPVNLEKESYIYYAELEEAYKYIKLNMSEGFETYSNITDQGGPPHLKHPIQYENLLKNDWKVWEVSTLQDIYEDTADVWNRIKLAIANVDIRKKNKNELDRVEERKREKARRRKENDERVRLKLLKKEQRMRLQRRKLEERGIVPNFTVITAPPRGVVVTSTKKPRSHVRFGF